MLYDSAKGRRPRLAGRRTFITRTAKKIVEAGGSLRDVQELAVNHTALHPGRHRGRAARGRTVVDPQHPVLLARPRRRCPACRTMQSVDLREVDRHPFAALTSLISALSCRSCRPHARRSRSPLASPIKALPTRCTTITCAGLSANSTRPDSSVTHDAAVFVTRDGGRMSNERTCRTQNDATHCFTIE